MSIVLARRLRGFQALLEMALRDERARPRPNDHTLAGIKKTKLAINNRLAGVDDRPMPSALR